MQTVLARAMSENVRGYEMNTTIGDLGNDSVLIIGDLMLDHYLMGSVDRISPEAPVPVVAVSNENKLLGGAGNVARNIASLGGSPVLVGVVGKDEDGRCIAEHCGNACITPRLVEDGSRPTTKKTRIIAHNQQVVRVDHEHKTILDDSVYDALFKVVAEELPKHKAVILSDYGKGLVSEFFMKRFMKLVNACPERPVVLVDPKTRNFDLYIGVDILTPNLKEASEGAKMGVEGKDAILRAGRAIISSLKSKHLLITLGADGMALFESDDTVYHIPTMAQKVFDVTGAGDTVIATLALALASGADLLTASTLANYAAGIVVGQIGAATVSKEELLRSYEENSDPAVTRW